jgi:GNAT superfamily N-acetyltransferase
MIVREARPGDVSTILKFIRGLARYENAADEVVATTGDLTEALFGDRARTRCLIAEDEGEAIGFALFFYNFSTWTGRSGIYLEDLFVEEAHRGTGAGFALMERLAQIAAEEGCPRFEWSVLDWNKPSIEFYEALGAEPQSEWIGYRLSGHALKRLAAPADED